MVKGRGTNIHRCRSKNAGLLGIKAKKNEEAGEDGDDLIHLLGNQGGKEKVLRGAIGAQEAVKISRTICGGKVTSRQYVDGR